MRIRNESNLKVYFVIKNEYKNENETSHDMQIAFMNTADLRVGPKWIRQSELDNILNEKGRVFVFEEFVDDFIKQFQETHPNARIIGPRCALKCIMEEFPVPNTLPPIFNTAMSNLIVCTAKLPPNETKEIEKLVGYMGGKFTDKLSSKTTHLVVNSVLGQRYFIAREIGVSVMVRDWVERIWLQNLDSEEEVRATDDNIIEQYSCPIFYNLKVTGSSISLEEKSTLKDTINNNGGIYSQELQNKVTDILITPVATGAKFKHAVRWGIPCLKPAWIVDCIEKGYAIPFTNYIVRAGNEISSTQVPKPVSQKRASLIDTNESEISMIPSNSDRNCVNDTEPKINESTFERCVISKEASSFKTPTKSCPKRVQQPQVSKCNISVENNISYKEVLSNIDLNALKKCGTIFDGCKLYLAGFNTNEEEKLRKILNYGGALRFTELNESITHIVVGNPSNVEIQRIQNIPNRPHVVKLDWLCNSIKQKSVVKESTCAYFEDDKAQEQSNQVPQQPSPLSKKGYQILNPGIIEKPETPRMPVIDRNLIQKYSQSSQDIEDCRPEPGPAPKSAVPIPVPVDNLTGPALSEHLSVQQSSTLFTGLKFALVGHDNTATETFKNTITEYGGTVVSNSRTIVDYAIVPVVQINTKITSNEIVTTIWLEECISNMRVMNVKYYHVPICTSHLSSKPLTNCVITLSSYERQEKAFLENLAKLLGAKCQDVLSKKVNETMDVVPTTHLICAQPQGVKYDAAKKWNLPIVTEAWIRDCFKIVTKLPVEDYLTMFAKSHSEASSISQKAEPPQSVRLDFEPSTAKSINTRRSISNQEIPNFCAAATSTKVGEAIKDVDKFTQNSAKKYLLRQSKSAEEVKPPMNGLSSAKAASQGSSFGENVDNVDECSKASRTNNGPTSLILEINASKRPNCPSAGKRKARDDSAERKLRSPKKKVRDVHCLTPLEEVGWHDTLTDISHRESGSFSAKRNLPSSTRIQHQPPAISQTEKRTLESSSAIASKQPKLVQSHVIMISLEVERDKIAEPIEKLGGLFVPTYEPDSKTVPRATHLIVEDLKKTEKMLCAIANGLWVLRESYLHASFQNKAFVKEEDHEWGNPKNTRFLENVNIETQQLAAAAYRWRIKILKEGPTKRPFVGMKVVVASGAVDGHVLSLQRIINAGGGRILQSKDVLKCTHCVLKNTSCLEFIGAPLQVLANERIHVVSAIYLRDFLIQDPPPDPKTRYIPEYLKFFK